MPVIKIDTDYLRDKAGDIATSRDIIEAVIEGLKGAAVNPVGSFFSSEGQAINDAEKRMINTLTKLNDGLEQIRQALVDEASLIETDVAAYEPELSQLTDEIKIANGFKPSGSFFPFDPGGDADIPVPVRPVPVRPVPPRPPVLPILPIPGLLPFPRPRPLPRPWPPLPPHWPRDRERWQIWWEKEIVGPGGKAPWDREVGQPRR